MSTQCLFDFRDKKIPPTSEVKARNLSLFLKRNAKYLRFMSMPRLVIDFTYELKIRQNIY
jgi:hypothetical protein